MFGKRILFLSPALNLNLKERAEKIYTIQHKISTWLNQDDDWFFDIKKPFDINNKEETEKKILDEFKKRVRKNTTIKDVPDEFQDYVASNLVIFGSKKYDNGLLFRYSLGCKDERSKFTGVTICNYEEIESGNHVLSFEDFIKQIVDLTDTIKIEVTENELAEKFKQLFANTPVEIVIMS